MIVCSFTMPIKAQSKQRPRAARGGHFYTPKRTREYEAKVKDMAKVMVDEAVTYPVKLCVSIEQAPPKSWPKWKKALALEGHISPNVGDLDNKVKAISDALNGVVFIDDNQICVLRADMSFALHDSIKVVVEKAGMSEDEIQEWVREIYNRGGAGVGG